MKKAVTVFTVLTPIAFLIWALAFCLAGLLGGDMTEFLSYAGEKFASFQVLWQAPHFWEFGTVKIYEIVTVGILAALFIGILLYIIIGCARKRYGYLWHILLAIIATVPLAVCSVNFETYWSMFNSIGNEQVGMQIIFYFIIGGAGLTTILMLVTWILFFVDALKNKGGKHCKEEKEVADPFGVDVAVEPAPAIGENGLTSKAIPASEPVPVKKESTMMDEIRNVVKEELERMRSSLQARQNVADTLNDMSRNTLPPESIVVPNPVNINDPRKDQPVKIVIMTENGSKKPEDVIKPNVVPMVQGKVDDRENVILKEEPLIEQDPLVVEEPLHEEESKVEPPIEEPIVEETPLNEETFETVPMEQDAEESIQEQEEEIEVVDETYIEEEEPLVEEVPYIEEEEIEVPPEYEEEPEGEEEKPEPVYNPEDDMLEEPDEEIEVMSEDDIIVPEEPQPEEEVEEPQTFESEPEGLITPPAFEEEPAADEIEKVAPVVIPTPVVEEVKPTYERISFTDRMCNADEEMKQHYNILKNEIMAYGVNSRVSNSGDAFRLHTKTYVKLTIAGKSLKLYFALDPKDYENTTLPIQDASNKGIYKEIPLVFKVKSDLSMKRAKDLIADAMAKDGLEQGAIEEIDYVEKLKDEVAAQDEE